MPEARTLADRQTYPSAIAVDAEHVYWTTAMGGALMRAPLRGGAPVTLARDLGCPLGLALDKSAVFVAVCDEDGAIVRVPKRGGEPQPVLAGQVFPGCVALDDKRVYWTTLGDDRDNGQVCSAEKDGGGFTVLAEGQVGPGGVGVDQDYVYWLTSYDYVLMAPKAGGPAVVLHRPHETVEERLAAGEAEVQEVDVPRSGMMRMMFRDPSPPWVRRLALEEETVYWQSASGAIACVGSWDSDRAESSPLLLAVDRDAPSDVALDGEWIYWVDHREGRVMRVPRRGGRPRVIAADQPGVIAIAVDAEAIYWAVTGSSPLYEDGAVRMKRKASLPGARRR